MSKASSLLQILNPLLKLESLRPVGAPECDGAFLKRLRVVADIQRFRLPASVGLQVFQKGHAVGLG